MPSRIVGWHDNERIWCARHRPQTDSPVSIVATESWSYQPRCSDCGEELGLTVFDPFSFLEMLLTKEHASMNQQHDGAAPMGAVEVIGG